MMNFRQLVDTYSSRLRFGPVNFCTDGPASMPENMDLQQSIHHLLAVTIN